MIIFPHVSGTNLEGKKFSLPQDLEGELNLVIIPFQQYQQILVDSWSNFLLSLQSKYPFFAFYELPILSFGYLPSRFLIDGGMRAGIADKKTRERTITLYLNKSNFRKLLDIKTEDTIHLFLITKDGTIHWKTDGEITKFKQKKLEEILKEH